MFPLYKRLYPHTLFSGYGSKENQVWTTKSEVSSQVHLAIGIYNPLGTAGGVQGNDFIASKIVDDYHTHIPHPTFE